MTLRYPDSVKCYFDNPKIYSSVNALIDASDGKKSSFSMDREEARMYNLALLSALQIRSDYIEFLYGIFDEIFGIPINENKIHIREEFTESEHMPNSIWNNGYIYSNITKINSKNNSIEISINEGGGGNLSIICLMWDSSEEVYINFELNETLDLSAWEQVVDDEAGHKYSVIKISYSDFCENSDSVIRNAKNSFRNLLKYFIENDRL